MDSPAFQAGLQNGDVITELNNTKVTSIENYHTELLSLKPDETYDVTVKRKRRQWLHRADMPGENLSYGLGGFMKYISTLREGERINEIYLCKSKQAKP